jgi:predicted signal transduction protein with EAL and GGDEF domain
MEEPMQNSLVHEIELYSPESFKTLLDHEVSMSHRYGDSLTLVDLIVESDPASERAQHSAEVFTINALNIRLRDTDIPCKKGNEFLVLMPATNASGARTACERLKKIMNIEPQEYDKVSFKLSLFIGMATLPVDDRTVSSDKLMQRASQALQHAQTNHLTKVVSYSELKE